MQLAPNMIEALLANASVYDLYCLNERISHVLDDESRIQQIKQSLQVGQSIQYFNSRVNNLVAAIIVEKQIKRVLVEDTDSHKRWWTRYYSINLNNAQLTPIIKPQCGALSKGNVSIGDMIWFEHNGNKIIGKVMKLNPKTVKVVTNAGMRWNVYYEHLFTIIDADQNIIDVLMVSNDGR